MPCCDGALQLHSTLILHAAGLLAGLPIGYAHTSTNTAAQLCGLRLCLVYDLPFFSGPETPSRV